MISEVEGAEEIEGRGAGKSNEVERRRELRKCSSTSRIMSKTLFGSR